MHRAQVPHRHRQDRQQRDHQLPGERPRHALVREHVVEEADEHREARRLGPHAEERRHRRGRALVDVGAPHVEGDGGDLVRKARHDEHARDERHRRGELVGGGLVREGPPQRGDLESAGEPVEEGHPVDHEAARRRAVDDVLQRRLGALPVLPEHARQDVARDAHELQREVHHQEVVRARHERHPERAGKKEREVLAPARLPPAKRRDGEERDQERRARERDLQEEREPVHRVGPLEDGKRGPGGMVLPPEERRELPVPPEVEPGHEPRERQPGQGDQPRGPAPQLRHEVHEDDEHDEARQDDLGGHPGQALEELVLVHVRPT